MLGINLLPSEEKRTVRTEEARRAVALFASCLTLAVLVGITLLMPSYFSSYLFRREMERALAAAEQDASRGESVRETLAEGKQIKSALGEVRASLSVSPDGADILEGFDAPGQGIAVLSVLIRADGDVVIEGRAETRDNLLGFEQRLRASERFLEVSFPLADIVRERNIRFSARARLKTPFAL
jgi:hypothetical protein